MIPTSVAFESTTSGRPIAATIAVSRPAMRENAEHIRIRLLPHYARHGRNRPKLTPDLIRRRLESTASLLAANGMRRRRHSDSASGPNADAASPNNDALDTSSPGMRVFLASRRHDSGNNTIDASDVVETGSTLHIVDERSVLLFVSAADSSLPSYATLRSGPETRVVGRRGNYGGFGFGDGGTPTGSQHSTWKNDACLQAPTGLDGVGPLPASSGVSSTTSTADRNYMTLAVGPGGTGGSDVHDGGLPTIVTTTADRSKSNRRRDDYGTSLAVPLTSHRSEGPTDDKATPKNERKSANGGSKIPPSATDELESSKKPSQQTTRAVDEEETIRTRRIKKCVGCCKSFIAFLFSTIGLTCLLVGYTILGGFIFKSIEYPHEKMTKADVGRTTTYHVEWLWNETADLNVLHPDNWTQLARDIFDKYTAAVIKAVKDQGWDGNYDGNSTSLQWSFEGALLYSITVITTIGYGHIAPKTPYGQVVTILYAVVGIPLTLLTITNLGGFMATAFRIFYKNVICGVCCCAFCCETTGKTAAARAAARRRKKRLVKTTSGENGGAGGGAAKKRRKTAGDSCSDAADDASSGGGRSSSNFQAKINEGVTPTSTVSYEVQFTSGLRRTLRSDDYSNVHVPIYVSFLLMVAYINVGAMLFLLIEDDWTYLISCYFCFITLSTVGFGDYVPGTGLNEKSHGKMVLCALYLIVGLSLLAMCFDLMQEEVRRKFRALGTKIGLFDRQN